MSELLKAVDKALETTPTLPRDDGTVQLARYYAGLIDQASPSATYAKHLRVLKRMVDEQEFQDVADAFQKISEALAAHSVASDLGPKLLAALTALGMTTASRAAKGGVPSGKQVHDELAALRDRANGRRAG